MIMRWISEVPSKIVKSWTTGQFPQVIGLYDPWYQHGFSTCHPEALAVYQRGGRRLGRCGRRFMDARVPEARGELMIGADLLHQRAQLRNGAP
jgi:hypothetical protein